MWRCGPLLLPLLAFAGTAGVAESQTSACPAGQVRVEAVDESSQTGIEGVRWELRRTAPEPAETLSGSTVCLPPGAAVVVTHPWYFERGFRVPREPAGSERVALRARPCLELHAAGEVLPAGTQLSWRFGADELHRRQVAEARREIICSPPLAADAEIAVMLPDGFAECWSLPRPEPGIGVFDVAPRATGSVSLTLLDDSSRPITGKARGVELLFDESAPGECSADLETAIARRGFTLDEPGRVLTLPVPAGELFLLRVVVPGYRDPRFEALRLRSGEHAELGQVVLVPGRELAGTVTDDAGTALGKVAVRALSVAKHGHEIDTTFSDEHGRFELEVASLPLVLVEAGSPPGPVVRQEVEAQYQDEVALTLPAAAGLQLRLVADGRPVAAGTVSIREAVLMIATNNPERWRGETGPDGTVRVESLAAGTYCARASAPGFPPTECTRFVLEPGETREVELVLAPGREIHGDVVERASGHPVAGARVHLETEGQLWETLTDDAGAFTLEGVPRGRLYLVAEKDGIGRARRILEGEDEEPTVLELRPLGEIRGTVEIDPAAPPGYLRVTLAGSRRATEVGRDGEFVLSDVDAGRQRVELVRQALGPFVAVQAHDVEVPPGGSVEVDFVVGVACDGYVTLEGEPLEGALLSWTRWEGERPGGNLPTLVVETTVDETGYYEARNLMPGGYTVTVSWGQVKAYREVHVERTARSFDIDLEGIVVEGVVRDADDGVPIAGAEVLAFDGETSMAPIVRNWKLSSGRVLNVNQAAGSFEGAVTSADGGFSLLLAPGARRLEARAEGYRSSVVGIQVNEKGAPFEEISLTATRQLFAQTVGMFQEPVAGAHVVVECAPEPGNFFRTHSREQGWFWFRDLPKGPCLLLAHTSDGRVALVRTTPVRSERLPEAPMTVPLQSGGELRVLLPASADRVLAGDLPLSLLDAWGQDLLRLVALIPDHTQRPKARKKAEQIEVVFPLLPPAVYSVVWPGVSARQVDVSMGRIAEIDLKSQP